MLPEGCLITKSALKMVTRNYERQQVMSAIESVLKRRDLCLELCASCGGDTLALASMFRSTLSIEVDPASYACLKYNIALQGHKNKV